MNKKEFFSILVKELQDLPLEERRKTENFYEELISDSMEDGLSEEEAVARLGDPTAIAREILGETVDIFETVKKTSTTSRIWIAVLLILGFPIWGSLLFAVLMLLLCVYMFIWIPIFILVVLCLSCLGGAIVLMAASPFLMFHNLPLGLVQFGFGLIMLGIFLISLLFMKRCWKMTLNGTKGLTKKIIGLFRRKRGE